MPPCLQRSEGDAKPDATAEEDGSDDQRKIARSDVEVVAAASEQLADLKVNPERGHGSHVPNVEAEEDPDLWKPLPLREDCPVCFGSVAY